MTPEKINRVAYIRTLGSGSYFWESCAFISALVHCLTPEETCEALDVNNEINTTLRGAILRKLRADIGAIGFLGCHATLIQRLLSVYKDLPANRRRGCGYCLVSLYGHVPEAQQTAMVNFFLACPHIEMRRRGYKLLRRNWDKRYRTVVDQVWALRKEPECALLIVEQYPTSFLEKSFEDLDNALTTPWARSSFYIRLGSREVAYLERLATSDEISAAYVRAKLKIPFTAQEAMNIFERNKFDDRIGLLLWSFGQMRLWDVLQELVEHMDVIQADLEKHIRYKTETFLSSVRNTS